MQKSRLYFVDKLRTFLTCVVVVHHVIWMLDPTAGSNWGLSYQYKAEPAKAVIIIGTYILQANQAYFMGLFFTLAGYFTVSSYKRKGCLQFVLDRACRLLIPVVVYEMVIAPVMLTIAQPIADPNNPPGLRDAPNAFQWYFANYKGWGNNPMWFVAWLFIFSLGYCLDVFNRRWIRALCCSRHKAPPADEEAAPAAADSKPEPQPTSDVEAAPAGSIPPRAPAAAAAKGAAASGEPITAEALPGEEATAEAAATGEEAVAAAPVAPLLPYSRRFLALAQLVLALMLTVGMFVVRLVFQDSWLGWGINFQYCYMPQYIMCFSLGCWMAHHSGFHRLRSAKWGAWSCVLGWFIFSTGFVVNQLLSVVAGDTLYFHPGTTFFYSFTQQTFAALWGSGLTMLFAAWANTQPSPLVKRMNGAAYTVYIIHPLIITIFNRAFVPLPLGPAQYIAVLAFPSFFVTWGLSIAITAIPGVHCVL